MSISEEPLIADDLSSIDAGDNHHQQYHHQHRATSARGAAAAARTSSPCPVHHTGGGGGGGGAGLVGNIRRMRNNNNNDFADAEAVVHRRCTCSRKVPLPDLHHEALVARDNSKRVAKTQHEQLRQYKDEARHLSKVSRAFREENTRLQRVLEEKSRMANEERERAQRERRRVVETDSQRAAWFVRLDDLRDENDVLTGMASKSRSEAEHLRAALDQAMGENLKLRGTLSNGNTNVAPMTMTDNNNFVRVKSNSNNANNKPSTASAVGGQLPPMQQRPSSSSAGAAVSRQQQILVSSSSSSPASIGAVAPSPLFTTGGGAPTAAAAAASSSPVTFAATAPKTTAAYASLNNNNNHNHNGISAAAGLAEDLNNLRAAINLVRRTCCASCSGGGGGESASNSSPASAHHHHHHGAGGGGSGTAGSGGGGIRERCSVGLGKHRFSPAEGGGPLLSPTEKLDEAMDTVRRRVFMMERELVQATHDAECWQHSALELKNILDSMNNATTSSPSGAQNRRCAAAAPLLPGKVELPGPNPRSATAGITNLESQLEYAKGQVATLDFQLQTAHKHMEVELEKLRAQKDQEIRTCKEDAAREVEFRLREEVRRTTSGAYLEELSKKLQAAEQRLASLEMAATASEATKNKQRGDIEALSAKLEQVTAIAVQLEPTQKELAQAIEDRRILDIRLRNADGTANALRATETKCAEEISALRVRASKAEDQCAQLQDTLNQLALKLHLEVEANTELKERLEDTVARYEASARRNRSQLEGELHSTQDRLRSEAAQRVHEEARASALENNLRSVREEVERIRRVQLHW